MNHERRVGILVAVASAILLAAVFLIGKVRLGVSGYYLSVQYRFVNNLRKDAPVKYAGGPVIGRVKSLSVDGDMVNVKLWIDRRVRIREDCEFWIFTTGMLGEQYVEVNASPSGDAPFLKEGVSIRGIDPVSIDATHIRFGKIIDALAPIFAKEEVADSVHAVVADLRGASRKIAALVDAHVGKMDEALTNLERLSAGLSRMSGDFEALGKNLRILSDPKNSDGLSSALTKTNRVLSDLETTADSVDKLIKKVESGKGTLGALIQDEKMAEDLKELIKRLKDKPITAKVRLF